MTRPNLNKEILVDDFARYYWLKEELVDFCRQAGLSTAGSKQELVERVRLFLETGQGKPAREVKPDSSAKHKVSMPQHFSRQTVICSGWRCSQELRTFFEQEIGRHFHFDEVMRDFIHHGAGKTLQEAITTWQTAQKNPEKHEIGAQFEYNRHMRNYFQAHPGATMQEALQAWKIIRETRREEDGPNE